MIGIDTLIYAFIGGLLPALLWLWFFLKEDSRCPEPKPLIILTFIAGMLSVLFVLPAEQFMQAIIPAGLGLVVVWAFIEELFKYLAVAATTLWRKAVNEPLDDVVYLITVALGFSAFENTLFLLNPLLEGDLINTILTGNLRFLGATLLHTVSSAAVGVSLAFAFYKSKKARRIALIVGIVLATTLHTVFNLFIMGGNGEQTLIAFSIVWVGVIVLLLIIEKIKLIRRPLKKYFVRKSHVKR